MLFLMQRIRLFGIRVSGASCLQYGEVCLPIFTLFTCDPRKLPAQIVHSQDMITIAFEEFQIPCLMNVERHQTGD